MVRGRLTVFFEDPFWVGLIEREADGEREAGRVVFGAEPTSAEIGAWVQTEYRRVRALPVAPPEAAAANGGVGAGSGEEGPLRLSPKRAKREAARALSDRRGVTRAQQALKDALAAQAVAAEVRASGEREAMEERRWALRVEKRKQKHRGH